ncbi:hypothetical protein [Aeromicrobium wangtongii]|uniref:PepSY domain-containing protein n=1 Tax=Aeromicrobium wangtongii TaxID=2969247 RepID=A0ABY5M220_9ACTN|nr:hypothetical protein [Aeromicrobium wangtongii]MCD9198227.1 hypothetical protein [Aeromicrobium wangtongii]UUP12263.1 hypothetical protein NQV15_10365 [Aeromicrobium wangtongii]
MTDTPKTQTHPVQPERISSWRSHPARWIAGGVGAAALLVGGIGLGSAMADDDGDDDDLVSRSALTDTTGTDHAEPAARHGATDAASLVRVLTAATAEAEGTPTSIEAHRDGLWSVDLETSNGDETTVLVGADGVASVGRTEKAEPDDADDPAPVGQLTEQNLTAVVEAVLAQAKGVISGVDLGDDPAEAYSVQVLTANGAETEIDLSSSFEVTQVDTDQD